MNHTNFKPFPTGIALSWEKTILSQQEIFNQRKLPTDWHGDKAATKMADVVAIGKKMVDMVANMEVDKVAAYLLGSVKE